MIDHLPSNIDEALRWFGALTLGDWQLFWLGLLTAAIACLLVGLVVGLLIRAGRGRGR